MTRRHHPRHEPHRHEPRDHESHHAVVEPNADEVDVHGLGIDSECPACLVLLGLLDAEMELRDCSLRLWVAGWSPIELLDEVVRVTGLSRSRDFMVQVLLVDDSHRSDQARTTEWNDRISALRAMTAIDDLSAGWLARWAIANHFSVESEGIVNGTLRTLQELLHPLAAA